MSTTVPIARSTRQVVRTATAGQTVFTFDAGPVWEAIDLKVQRKIAPATGFTTITTGFTVALLGGGVSGALVTFATAPRPTGGDPAVEIRITAKRTHERMTDVSRSGRVHTPSLEREHDKITTTLQELRRDVDQALLANLIDLAAQAVDAANAAVPSAAQAAVSAQLAADAANAAALVTGALPRVTKAMLEFLDPATIQVAMVTDAGEPALFLGLVGDYSAYRTADTYKACWVPNNSNPTGSGKIWRRIHDPREFRFEWWSPVEGTSANNAARYQAAMDYMHFMFGGTLHIGSYYRVTAGVVHGGNDIVARGRNLNCGIYSDIAGFQLYKVTGLRHRLDGVILQQSAFTSSPSDYCLWLDNAVKFVNSYSRIYGGYYAMAITGNACADTLHDNVTFSYATGPAMVYMVRTALGVNGAHHFRRCLLNLEYLAGYNPANSTPFKGNWTAATVVAAGDIYTVGDYRLQARLGGTTAATAPIVNMWHLADKVDGGVTWRLLAHVSLVGFDIDAGIIYVTMSGCDITGPYASGLQTRNSVGGVIPDPYGIFFVEMCTVHGPLFVAANLVKGTLIQIVRMESHGSIFKNGGAGTICIYVAPGVESVTIHANGIRDFDVGVLTAGRRVDISAGNSIVGCTRGVRAIAGAGDFNVIGNFFSSQTVGGACITPVEVDVAAINDYDIVFNKIGGCLNPVTDGGTGLRKKVDWNHGALGP